MALTFIHRFFCSVPDCGNSADSEIYDRYWNQGNKPPYPRVPDEWRVIGALLICPLHRLRLDTPNKPATPPMEVTDTCTVVPGSSLVCEEHPWLEWPHGDCAGPGMPYSSLIGLEERAGLLSNTDYKAFRALLFEVRRAQSSGAMWPCVDQLAHHVYSPSVDGP